MMVDLGGYDDSGSRQRHLQVIREYLRVRPYGRSARAPPRSTQSPSANFWLKRAPPRLQLDPTRQVRKRANTITLISRNPPDQPAYPLTGAFIPSRLTTVKVRGNTHDVRFFPSPPRGLFIEVASSHAMASAAHRRRPLLALFPRQRACPLSAVL